MSKETVAIIPCTNQKSEVPGKARDVWIGGHFQLVLAHAEIFYDRVLVMSYKYGLISPDDPIEPYDIDIRTGSAGDKLRWWYKMREDIRELAKTEPLLVALYTGNIERERIIREFVRNGVRQVIVPFDGASIGKRMEMVYDLEEPFNRARAEAGEYALAENYGESDVATGSSSSGGKYAPPPTAMTDEIEWEE